MPNTKCLKTERDHMREFDQESHTSIPQQENKNTIFCIWNSDSDEFQASLEFTSIFGINPRSFADVKTLIFKDDLIKLTCTSKENIEGKNNTIILRMKVKGQDYISFIARFGKMGQNMFSGTLDFLECDKQKPGKVCVCIDHARRKFALEAASAGLWDWNIVTGEVYYDDRYITMLGYKPNEFAQTLLSWTERVHPDDYEETVNKQLRYVQKPDYGDFFTCKFRFLAANGEYLWVRGQGKILGRDSSGKALRVVGLHFDITEDEESKMQTEFVANYDVLTGLHNRNHFEIHFSQNDIHVLPSAYILIDADGLKMINDCVNHAAGDMMLQKLAHTLLFAVRSSDLLARIGGDEFAIFLPHTGEVNAKKVLKKIREDIEAVNKVGKGIITCASIGLACAETMEELLTIAVRADAAMIKEKKKNRPESLRKIKKWINSLGLRYSEYKDNRIYHE